MRSVVALRAVPWPAPRVRNTAGGPRPGTPDGVRADALPFPVLLVNGIGTIVDANTAASHVFAGSGPGLIGLCVLDLLPLWDPGRFPPDPDAAGDPADDVPERTTARRTDGTEFPAEIIVRGVPYRDAGVFGRGAAWPGTAFLVTVRDIGERLRLEAELRYQRGQTELILRAASEGVVGVDAFGRIVMANPAAIRLLGYRAGELRGRDLVALAMHAREDGSALPPRDTPVADTLRSGRRHHETSAVLWSKAGRAVPVRMTTLPQLDGGQVRGAVVTFREQSSAARVSADGDRVPGWMSVTLADVLEQAVGTATELLGARQAEYTLPVARIELPADVPQLVSALAHLIAGEPAVVADDPAPWGAADRAPSTVTAMPTRDGAYVRIDIRSPGPSDDARVRMAHGIVERHGGVLRVADGWRRQGCRYRIDLPADAAAAATAGPDSVTIRRSAPAPAAPPPRAVHRQPPTWAVANTTGLRPSDEPPLPNRRPPEPEIAAWRNYRG